MPITKKHKSILFSGIALMAGATLLAGCSADPLPVSKSEQYTRDFIKTFGAFDQSHDWNHATQATVTVTTPAPTEVKIMADFEGKRYIFATYTNVEGTKTLNVDIPKGISDLIVAANGKNYSVKAGGEVSLTGRGSRATADEYIESSAITVVPKSPTEEIHVTGEYISKYADILPEDGQNMGREEVSFNFRFDNPGKSFVVYPVLWYSDTQNTVGFYWEEDGKKYKQPIYTTKAGDNLGYETPINEGLWFDPKYLFATDTDSPYFEIPYDYSTEEIPDKLKAEINNKYPEGTVTNWSQWSKADWDEFKGLLEATPRGWDASGKYRRFTSFEVPENWDEMNDADKQDFKLKGWFNLVSIATLDNKKFTYSKDEKIPGVDTACDDLKYYSRGITVTIPESIKTFGMYLENTSGIVFSESQLNSDFEINWTYKQTKVDGVYQEPERVTVDKYNAPFAATFNRHDLTGAEEVNSFQRIAFEDCLNTAAQYYGDFNDVVLYIKGLDGNIKTGKPGEEIPEPDPEPEPEEWQWIIACEDLGTNDFDFNDVVFSVSAVTTESEGDDMKSYVKVKALASGGTLPVYVYFEKDGVRKRIAPEGTDAEFHKWFGDHHHSKVINASSFRAEGKTARIEVPNGFTMACNEKDNMGGFAVGVIYPDKEEIIEASSPGTINSNKNPELIGKAPQMICVPYSWYWPTENTFIVDVYEGFTGWCKDPENNGHWHKNPKGNYWQ